MCWLLGVLLVGVVVGEEVGVNTSKGRILGYREDLEDGESYYAFKGIPYAQPPVKELRFKDPLEAKHFELFAASADGNLCPQFDISNSDPMGDEDCLNLNVYTPRVDSKKRAVMVYFHGGAYIMGGGSSQFFKPNHILLEDIVVVTFNSRLGALGFLSTSDGSATGNQGLKDQIMMLKWVKENIAKFGGNPDRVTLMGEDSGAASISIMAMSPLAKGLFHGAIMLSGNALCDQYIQLNPSEASTDLATRMECNTETGADVIKCLEKKTQQEIVKASQDMYMFWSYPRWFAPIVDGTVLPDTPENLLQAGKFAKVPFMVGQTKDEGAAFYRLTLNAFNNGQYDDNFVVDKVPRLLPVVSNFDSKLYPIARQVQKRYFANTDMESEDEFRPKYVNFLTDLLYTRCVDRFAKVLSSHSVPTYQYSFEYRGQYSIVNLQGEQVDMGVAHGDDLQYVFQGIWGEDLEMSKSDTKFSKNIFVPLLANFAKTSVPTPTLTEDITVSWPPLTPTSHRVLRIDSKLRIEENYLQDRLRFWTENIPKLFQQKAKKGKNAKKGEKEEL